MYTKESVNFEHPATGMDHCSNCRHYRGNSHSCTIVEGVIEPGDWCEKFEAKGKMAKLTSAERKALPSKDFVFPGKRKFPIEDKNHARDALSRAAHKGGEVEKRVRAAVHRKYPGIGKGKTTTLGSAMKEKY